MLYGASPSNVVSVTGGGNAIKVNGPTITTAGAVATVDDFEEETVKSESEASAAGHSPQALCSGHSESSSGVHSNSSQETAATMPLPPPPPPLSLSSPTSSTDEQKRRASYADLQQATVDTVVMIRHKGGPGAKARMPPDPCTRPTNVALSSFTEPRGPRNRPGSVPGWKTMPHNAPVVPPQTPSHYHQQQKHHYPSYQRQQQQQQQPWSRSNGGTAVAIAAAAAIRSRNHSTIPTHHNGVRLFQQQQQPSYRQ